MKIVKTVKMMNVIMSMMVMNVRNAVLLIIYVQDIHVIQVHQVLENVHMDIMVTIMHNFIFGLRDLVMELLNLFNISELVIGLGDTIMKLQRDLIGTLILLLVQLVMYGQISMHKKMKQMLMLQMVIKKVQNMGSIMFQLLLSYIKMEKK